MLPQRDLKDILEQDRYKKLINRLSNDTLQRILKDRSEAQKYARKGIAQVDPDNLNEGYIEKVTDGMQLFAKFLLEKREQ